ncbi:hypothetical protein RB620_23670 [Paenibacillus sp. LHD-117]|uniref:hypothetical protein n=1 Tax=Paenibacillus sp. LHD-117 TaxID=3071412 RepID=UPI0027DED745|nr:hypothetical protein [Paenibacillus sp. LHD-117]MDQ6422434.1 hypothetical protein [Paenibacillus sp. LHD-117]
MDFYHSWFYMHVLNTKWLLWTIVASVLAAHLLLPIIIWYTTAGKNWIRKFRNYRRQRQGT